MGSDPSLQDVSSRVGLVQSSSALLSTYCGDQLFFLWYTATLPEPGTQSSAHRVLVVLVVFIAIVVKKESNNNIIKTLCENHGAQGQRQTHPKIAIDSWHKIHGDHPPTMASTHPTHPTHPHGSTTSTSPSPSFTPGHTAHSPAWTADFCSPASVEWQGTSLIDGMAGSHWLMRHFQTLLNVSLGIFGMLHDVSPCFGARTNHRGSLIEVSNFNIQGTDLWLLCAAGDLGAIPELRRIPQLFWDSRGLIPAWPMVISQLELAQRIGLEMILNWSKCEWRSANMNGFPVENRTKNRSKKMPQKSFQQFKVGIIYQQKTPGLRGFSLSECWGLLSHLSSSFLIFQDQELRVRWPYHRPGTTDPCPGDGITPKKTNQIPRVQAMASWKRLTKIHQRFMEVIQSSWGYPIAYGWSLC